MNDDKPTTAGQRPSAGGSSAGSQAGCASVRSEAAPRSWRVANGSSQFHTGPTNADTRRGPPSRRPTGTASPPRPSRVAAGDALDDDPEPADEPDRPDRDPQRRGDTDEVPGIGLLRADVAQQHEQEREPDGRRRAGEIDGQWQRALVLDVETVRGDDRGRGHQGAAHEGGGRRWVSPRAVRPRTYRPLTRAAGGVRATRRGHRPGSARRGSAAPRRTRRSRPSGRRHRTDWVPDWPTAKRSAPGRRGAGAGRGGGRAGRARAGRRGRGLGHGERELPPRNVLVRRDGRPFHEIQPRCERRRDGDGHAVLEAPDRARQSGRSPPRRPAPRNGCSTGGHRRSRG